MDWVFLGKAVANGGLPLYVRQPELCRQTAANRPPKNAFYQLSLRVILRRRPFIDGICVTKPQREAVQSALGRVRRQWRRLARREDPLWAVLADPRRNAADGWDVDEFFATGEIEIRSATPTPREAGASASPRHVALDFRLRRRSAHPTLRAPVERAIGVDVSHNPWSPRRVA